MDDVPLKPVESGSGVTWLMLRAVGAALMLVVVYYTGRHGLAFFYQGF